MDISQYANDWRDGDSEAGNRLFREIEAELRQLASTRLAAEKSCSLSPDELVNEAVIRLAALERIDWKSRAHILALTSSVMRQVLVDHMRRKKSAKRFHQPVTLSSDLQLHDPKLELTALNEAMEELQKIEPNLAKIVEMRYFGGMSSRDIATVLELSEATVKRRWRVARGWLRDHLDQSE